LIPELWISGERWTDVVVVVAGENLLGMDYLGSKKMSLKIDFASSEIESLCIHL
jgi:hypothetical protein